MSPLGRALGFLCPSTNVTIEQAGSALALTPLQIANAGAKGFPTTFVVGKEAVTHYAVLVTSDVPVLVAF